MKLFETKYWEVGLVKDQAYLGRSVVVLKREDCGDISDLTGEEISNFLEVVKKLEIAIRKAFGAEMFNWTCLMNNAYKESPPNPHVHWHCRPRYRKPVNFKGVLFEDTEFAHHYDNERHRNVEELFLKKIADKIKEVF